MGLRELVTSVIDVILPLHERSARTKSRTSAAFVSEPRTYDILDTTVTTLFSYKDAAAHDAIGALKFERSEPAARLLAASLADYLFEEVANLHAYSPGPILVVPIPLHTERLRERGFNQVERVLAHLPAELHSCVHTDILLRTRDTPHQTTLSRSKRLVNVRGAFALASGAQVRGAHVILVDDVTTTGATLVHAAAPLKDAGAEVSLLALAHA